MITTNELDSSILVALKERFNSSQEKTREGAKGKKFKYISVHSIRERLEECLGLNWNWEILETKSVSFYQKNKATWNKALGRYNELPTGTPEYSELPGVVITGRLTIQLPSGLVISRDGNGGASADKGMGPGDAEKMADSNALKRAAWKFGVGAYLGLDSEEALDDVTYDQSYTQSGAKPSFNGQTKPRPVRQPIAQSNPQASTSTIKRNPLIFRAN